LRRHDAQLAAVLVDDPDFLGADAVVDANRLLLYETPPGIERAASSALLRSFARRAIFSAIASVPIGPRSPACRWRTETL
jgi:hypothetical protein